MEDCLRKRQSIPNINSSPNLHMFEKQKPNSFSHNKLLRRDYKSLVIKLEDEKVQEIFQKAHSFIRKLFNCTYLKQTFEEMEYENHNETVYYVKKTKTDICQHNSNNSMMSEEKFMNPSLESLENVKLNLKMQFLQLNQKNQRKKQGRYAKVSIMLENLSEITGGSGSRISIDSTNNVCFNNMPTHKLTTQMIQKIFHQPDPLLINLAMCLVLKFLFFSKIIITSSNACWILSIGCLIAHKIYYDEQVRRLIQSFSQILQMSQNQVKELERFFLNKISFQTAITNHQYHLILCKIVCGENNNC